MKKKDKKKLIRNTFLIFTLILLFCVCMGFMLLINHLIHVTVNNKPDVIAYKETAGYLYIIVAVFFLLMDCFIPYAIMDKKLTPGKTNPKVPKYRKPGKGEGLLKKIKITFWVLNIFIVLIAFPIAVNSRWELHSDGIYKITITGKEKLLCSSDEIICYSVQLGKSGRSHKNYFPQVVAKTSNEDFYLQTFKNARVKKDFFLEIKNMPGTEIDVLDLRKYYNRFSDENKLLMDLLIGE